MSDDVLDRTQQALNGVPDGPWEVIVKTYSSDIGDYEAAYIPGVVEEGASGYDVEPHGPLTVPDAEFIAASRSLLSELAEQLRTARANAAALIGRLEKASRELDALTITQQARSEIDRLQHKRQGVQLALSYAREYPK